MNRIETCGRAGPMILKRLAACTDCEQARAVDLIDAARGSRRPVERDVDGLGSIRPCPSGGPGPTCYARVYHLCVVVTHSSGRLVMLAQASSCNGTTHLSHPQC